MAEKKEELQGLILELRNNINNPKKNTVNGFFKSQYADLGQVLEVLTQALPKGLNFVQPTKVLDNGSTVLQLEFFTETESKVVAELPIIEVEGGKTNRLQMFGQSLTYQRRYLLTTYLGLNAEDNDGNSAMQQAGKQQSRPVQRQQAPKPHDVNTNLLVDQLKKKTKQLADLRGEDPNNLLNRLGNLDTVTVRTIQSYLNSVDKAIKDETK